MNHKSWRFVFGAAVCAGALLAQGCRTVFPAKRGLDEAKMIAVLQGGADWEEKQAACRSLRRIGTADSIPALAALLPDEKLSHVARYALEPMPCPEAGQALREALATTSGMPKIGVIVSIGARRDARAVALLTPLLRDSNAEAAGAAAGALGRIATPEAVKALMDFRRSAPEEVRPALAEGLLAAGQLLVQEGEGDRAVPIYEDLLAPGSNWPEQTRLGAFRGLAYAQPEQAPARLIEALGGADPLFRGMAAQIVAETSGAKATKQYAAALPQLPPAGQAALLRALADRKDPAARPAVAQALESSDEPVRLAAAKALGTIGATENVAALAKWLASDDADLAAAAKASLTIMRGEAVNVAISGAIPGAPPAARAALIELLSNRDAPQTVPSAVQGLKDSDAAARIAALRALALSGGNDQAPEVIAILMRAADASERDAAEKALGAIGSRGGDKTLALVLDAMNGADEESRLALLRVTGRIGGAKALEAVLAALDDPNTLVGEEAARALSNWPTLDAAPRLLELAQGDDVRSQVLGLRGYVRLARTEPSAEKKAGMLATAMDLAKRPDEQKLVLAAWGTLPTKQSLDVLLPRLDDPAVRDEAASAIIAVAENLGRKDKTQAVEALNAVVKKCQNPTIRKNAQKALRKLK